MKSVMRRAAGHFSAVGLLALGVGIVLFASACGYALAGRGNSLPVYIRTIGVPQFTNESTWPDLDLKLTEAVRVELSSRGNLRVVPESSGVDGVLRATIRPVRVDAAAFTENRQASRYVITIVAAIEFREMRDASGAPADKVFWQNPTFRISDEYDVTDPAAANDPSELFRQDANALDRLAKNFARSVVSSILEAF